MSTPVKFLYVGIDIIHLILSRLKLGEMKNYVTQVEISMYNIYITEVLQSNSYLIHEDLGLCLFEWLLSVDKNQVE